MSLPDTFQIKIISETLKSYHGRPYFAPTQAEHKVEGADRAADTLQEHFHLSSLAGLLVRHYAILRVRSILKLSFKDLGQGHDLTRLRQNSGL